MRNDVIFYDVTSLRPEHTRAKYKIATTFGLNSENSNTNFMTIGDVTTWKELAIAVSLLARLLFDYDSINSGLVL